MTMHSKLPVLLVGAASALGLTLTPGAAVAQDGGGDNLIRGHLTASMPTDDAIDGVPPGGLPWVIDRGEVRVRANGRMDVRIEGLQIPFPAPDVTRNPVANIHAVLYCSGAAAATVRKSCTGRMPSINAGAATAQPTRQPVTE